MVTGERLTITITGGAPWGFRLFGGENFPLEVAKIRKKSHASDAGLQEGDTVVSINGVPMKGSTHQSAMGLVEASSNQIVMEVIRSKSSSGALQTQVAQSQPRIIPMVEGDEKSGPGLVSKASANYSTTEGNIKRDVHTDEIVMKSGDGKRITKTVTEERVTRIQDSLSPSRPQNGVSPAQSHGSIYGLSSSTSQSSIGPASTSHSSSFGLSPSRGHGGLSPAQSQSSLYGLSSSTSQTSVISGEHVGRSPNRSPLMWKPPSQSTSSERSSVLQEKSKSYQPDINIGVESNNVSSAPIAKPSRLFKPTKTVTVKEPTRTVTVKETIVVDKAAKSAESKENEDPIKISEQAKWEARKGPESVPKFKLENFGCNTFPRSYGRKQSLERVDDPRYPMFEVYKPSWRAPVENVPLAPQVPPVPPKPVSPVPPPMSYPEENQRPAHTHFPGMIRPPAQNFDILQLQPPPPPPPMPPAMGPPPTAPKPKKFRPGSTSTPLAPEEEHHHHHHRPDHIPVFAPKVYFAPEDDSGFPGSPTRSDSMNIGDEHSDVSSLTMTTRKKLFSDSAFYDDPSHRYPTIDEQMSMCKKIAQSLTSAANRRAKGARMFLKRKRKSNKWVHDELTRFSEYSSEPGDVADLDELDSELYVGEGGSRPLFQFRIPNIAGQRNAPAKMSLSKDEFERLRLGSTKCDHHNVSPDMCFSIAADLHSNTRNKGAKLFHKRQQRVEKFVIDESNVPPPVTSPTKLEQILQNPTPMNKTPWNAAAQGNVQAAFTPYTGPMPTAPKHTLEPLGQVKLLGGDNYNRKIKGWVSSSQPTHQGNADVFVFPPEQPNFPPMLEEVSSHSRTEEFVQSTVDYHEQEQSQSHNQPQFGDYNRRMKGWGVQQNDQKAPVSHLNEQYRYKGSETYFPVPGTEL